MAKEVVVTHEGYKKLEEELDTLKTVKRSEIAEKIKVARGYGDLSENAEYDAAKEEQGRCEARIKALEGKLSSANIIDVTKLKGAGDLKVMFGATVTVEDVDSGKQTTYRIVGEDEADISKNIISYKTPIARGLMGKHVDDEIDIHIPKGTVTYDVINIEYINYDD